MIKSSTGELATGRLNLQGINIAVNTYWSAKNTAEYRKTPQNAARYRNSVLQKIMLQVVAPEWLEECLAEGIRVHEQKYQIQLEYCCDSGGSWPDTTVLLCCAVLCSAVLCCAVQCCVLCCTVLCCASNPLKQHCTSTTKLHANCCTVTVTRPRKLAKPMVMHCRTFSVSCLFLPFFLLHVVAPPLELTTDCPAVCGAETSEEEVSLSSVKGKVSHDDSASSQPGRLYKYRRWLGHWQPAHDHIQTETELALHVCLFILNSGDN